MKRCGRKGYAQWDVCADANTPRVLCYIHDIELNRLTLEWIGDPDAASKMERYEESVRATVGT